MLLFLDQWKFHPISMLLFLSWWKFHPITILLSLDQWKFRPITSFLIMYLLYVQAQAGLDETYEHTIQIHIPVSQQVRNTICTKYSTNNCFYSIALYSIGSCIATCIPGYRNYLHLKNTRTIGLYFLYKQIWLLYHSVMHSSIQNISAFVLVQAQQAYGYYAITQGLLQHCDMHTSIQDCISTCISTRTIGVYIQYKSIGTLITL